MAKKALLVGINYKGTRNELDGCANDIKHTSELLSDNGFTDITMLSDDLPDEDILEPTKENILAELNYLITHAKPGDTLFFHYSGHGTKTARLSSIVPGKTKSAICPLDMIENNDDRLLIYDDDFKLIVNRLVPGAKLFVLMDCCHSGTMFDLKTTLNTSRRIAPASTEHGFTFVLSACRDYETDADTWDKKRKENIGALTDALLAEVEKSENGLEDIFAIGFSNSRRRVQSMLDNIRQWMREHRFSQRPAASFEGQLYKEKATMQGFTLAGYHLRQTAARQARRDKNYAAFTKPCASLDRRIRI